MTEVNNKFPESIMRKLRQREDLESDDTSMDNIFNNYSPDTAFEEVCGWEGLINYSFTIKNWIKDIYKIEL
jgi:hypothetical protein